MVSLWDRPWSRPELLARPGGYGTSWHGDECVLWAEGEVVQARPDGRRRGELQHLAPGEERRYTLEIGVLSGAAQIGQLAGQTWQLAAPDPAEAR